MHATLLSKRRAFSGARAAFFAAKDRFAMFQLAAAGRAAARRERKNRSHYN